MDAPATSRWRLNGDDNITARFAELLVNLVPRRGTCYFAPKICSKAPNICSAAPIAAATGTGFARQYLLSMIFSVASSPASPVSRVVQRFFLFWRHGCSADRNSPACKGKSLRCSRKCRFSYIDTSPALSARRHLTDALRPSACPPQRPSRLHLGCQTHQTYYFAHLQSPYCRGSPVARIRFKGGGVCGALASTSKFLA